MAALSWIVFEERVFRFNDEKFDVVSILKNKARCLSSLVDLSHLVFRLKAQRPIREQLAIDGSEHCFVSAEDYRQPYRNRLR